MIIGVLEVLFGLLWLFYRRKELFVSNPDYFLSIINDCRGRFCS